MECKGNFASKRAAIGLDNANGHCAVLGHQRLKLQLISSSSLQLTSFLIPAYDQGNKIVGTKGHPRLSNIFILITGCSGGGKSTLLDALGAKGYGTIPEPGRRIVASEIAGSGKNLPWVDMEAFAQSALNMARSDLKSAKGLSGTMFFDRGVVDAAVALQAAGGAPFGEHLAQSCTIQELFSSHLHGPKSSWKIKDAGTILDQLLKSIIVLKLLWMISVTTLAFCQGLLLRIASRSY